MSQTTPRKLNIHWVVQGIKTDAQAHSTSALASNRYRVISPAAWLAQQGHGVNLIPAEQWQYGGTHTPDVLLVGKMLPSGSAERIEAFTAHLLHHIQAARNAGVPVLADFNDDHFQHPILGKYWRALSSVATVCVAGSAEMGTLLKKHTDQPIHVIGDPIGSPFAEPKVFNPSRPFPGRGLLSQLMGPKKPTQRCLNMAWYGNPVNWQSLQDWMEQLAPLAQRQPFRVWALTRIAPSMQAYATQFNQMHSPGAVIELQEWNEHDQWDVVRDADVVLVPSDTSDPTKRVKTGNRLTDALHMGRTVVASPLPEYLPYTDAAWLTEQPLDALNVMLSMPDVAMRKVVAGQQLVLQRCSSDEVGKKWHEAIITAIQHPRFATNNGGETQNATDSDTAPVRLNLGCGDKILPGFVNIDMADNWSKRQPDIIADVTQRLPFSDNYADEIHAYHVLEHLQRWKASDCLAEWTRVLKPGGKLILEMPCLDKILGIYFDSKTENKTPNPRLTILGLFGDPTYQSDAMMHKWCYSCEEILDVLKNLPLVSIKLETPLTHIAIRDMRLTALKMSTN